MIDNIKSSFTRNITILALVILVLVMTACSGSNAVLASDILSISEGLNCACGSCDELLSECNCETAKKMTSLIESGLSKGHSEEQIIQDLVRQYGQRVLATKSGA